MISTSDLLIENGLCLGVILLAMVALYFIFKVDPSEFDETKIYDDEYSDD